MTTRLSCCAPSARADYDISHGKLMRYSDGRALHADTITRRFNRLVDLAGVRRIRLHDVRHTYATLSLDSGVHAKIVSDRMDTPTQSKGNVLRSGNAWRMSGLPSRLTSSAGPAKRRGRRERLSGVLRRFKGS